MRCHFGLRLPLSHNRWTCKRNSRIQGSENDASQDSTKSCLVPGKLGKSATPERPATLWLAAFPTTQRCEPFEFRNNREFSLQNSHVLDMEPQTTSLRHPLLGQALFAAPYLPC